MAAFGFKSRKPPFSVSSVFSSSAAPRRSRRKCFPLESGCKPGSVPTFVALRGWWSFIWAARCRTAQATNSGSGIDAGHAGGLPHDPSSVLLQVGFAVPLLSPGERCALTTPFHPYPIARLPACLAVYFLLHCPSSHLDWPLASTLPSGARTFLGDANAPPRPHFELQREAGGV